MRRIIALVLLTVIGLPAYCQLKITFPLKGIPGKDYFIDYYVDHGRGTGHLKDAYGGTKTYEGHKGTDFLLKNFAAMDSGVYVYAVADGVVYEMADGNFDRNKHWIKGTKSNFVGIGCAGNIYFIYHHMMKHSILVKVGDSVKCGQPIGKVGSSGYSCYPHVHLEVRNKFNMLLEPFKGNYEHDTSVSWLSEPPYDTAVYCIDNGFVPYVPGFDSLLEGQGVTDTFYIKKDKKICFWAQMHGLKAGDKLKYIWITPKGRIWNVFDYTWTKNWWYDYSWSYIDMVAKRGKWELQYAVNDTIISKRDFYIK